MVFLVRVCDERGCVVLKDRLALRCLGLQVREVLDLAGGLVEEGTPTNWQRYRP
jgi:hypothetical protein